MKLAAYSKDADHFDLDERAGVLARTISRKLTNLLKKDPVVTAHALAKYDRRLPRALMDVWSGQMATPAPRNLTEPEMKRQAEVMRQRADAIDVLLAKRAEDRPKALDKAGRRHEEKARKVADGYAKLNAQRRAEEAMKDAKLLFPEADEFWLSRYYTSAPDDV